MLPASWPTGRLALGMWVKIAAPEVVELAALAGFDFVVLDMEHAPLGIAEVARLVPVATGSGVAPFVRVPEAIGSTAGRVLDAGAAGVLLPRVDSVAIAHAAAAACRFPPQGTRGAGNTSRAGAWGLRPMPDYLRDGAEQVAVIAQIESRAAVDAVAGIAAVPGIDGVFVGPADLRLSLGGAGPRSELTDAVRAVEAHCRAAAVPMGTVAADASAVAELAASRYRFAVLGNDATLLAMAARDVVAAGRAVGFYA
ncbi:MAG: HpcH/HpaI aldolase family protein [Jatrophihabitans sp.]